LSLHQALALAGRSKPSNSSIRGAHGTRIKVGITDEYLLSVGVCVGLIRDDFGRGGYLCFRDSVQGGISCRR